MSDPEYPDVPEIVDIALRNALAEAKHPRVRELIRDAMQLRFCILDGVLDPDGFVYHQSTAETGEKGYGVIVAAPDLGEGAWISCSLCDVRGEP